MEVSEVLMYLRKSRADGESETVEEVLKKHEIQLQEFALYSFGQKISEENIYREVMSGETIESRPQMQEILRRIESPRIKAVLVIEPQRLTRGDLEDCGKIIRVFRYTGTNVITPMKAFDLSNEFDRDYFEMELMSGKKFLEYTKKILSRGRIASVNRGNYIGTYAPYGYDKIKIGKDCTLALNEYSEIVKMIFKMYVNEQMSLVAIADRLNNMGIKPMISPQFEAFSIRAILTNPIYIGYLRWGYKHTVAKYKDGKMIKTNPTAKDGDYMLVKGKHPAIIDEELFEAAKKRLGQNPRITKERQLVNILAGVFFCQCGKAMNYRVYKKHGEEICRPRYHCTKQKFCHTRGAPANDVIRSLKKILINDITRFELELKRRENKAASNNSLTDTLSSELSGINKMQDRLYELLESGTYTEEVFKERMSKLENKKTTIIAALNSIKEKQDTIDYKDVILKLKTIVDVFDDSRLTNAEKNTVIKMFIQKITYINAGSDFSLRVEYEI